MSFYECCALIAVIFFAVLVIAAVRTLLQITQTAKSVEILTYSITEKVDKTEQVFDMVDKTAALLNCKIFQAIGAGVALVNRLRQK